MVRDARNDVKAAMGHRFVGCVCVGNRDHAILITADDHHWHTRIEMQAIQCTDRLAAAVYDGTQRSQECLPVFWVRQRGMSFPMFAQS